MWELTLSNTGISIHDPEVRQWFPSYGTKNRSKQGKNTVDCIDMKGCVSKGTIKEGKSNNEKILANHVLDKRPRTQRI